MPKTAKIFLELHLILQKFPWRHWLHFDRTPEKIPRNFEKFSAEGPKKSGIKVFIEAFFPQKNLVDKRSAVFKTMQNFLPEVRKSFGQTQKPKKTFFSTLYHLFEKLFWRQKLNPSQNFPPEIDKLYTHSPKTNLKYKYLLIQFSSGEKECNFENLVKKTTKSYHNLSLNPEKIQKVLVFVVWINQLL